MSIATRIESISNHLENAYNSLENIGVDLENIDKNINNLSAQIESVYNDLPKVTDEDAEITLSPTRKGKMELTLKGNTEQFTTTGKNKMNLENFLGTEYGLTVTQNDEFMTINGTATANRYVNLNQLIGDGSTYTLSVKVISGTGGGGAIQTYAPGQVVLKQSILETGSKSDTLANGTTYTNRIVIDNGTSFNNLKIQIQLEKNSTSTEWEPYTGGVASPNPDYPQDIQTITGDNIINVCGKNLFNKNTTNITNLFITNTSAINSSGTVKSLYIPCKPNTTYTVSKISSQRFVIGTTSVIPASGGTVSGRQDLSTSTSGTITTDSNANYLMVYYYSSSSDTLSEETIRNSIQIEKNSIATAYEDYHNTSYFINLGTENLFNKNNVNIIDAFVNGDTGLLASPTNNQKSIVIPVLSKTTYTISGIERPSSNYGLFDDTTLTIGTSIATKKSNIIDGKMTFTTGENTKWFVFLLKGGTQTYGYDNIMFEKGNQVNSYFPYGTAPIELCKIPNTNYEDYFLHDKTLDKWYLHKKIGKYKFTGNETLNSISEGYYMLFSGLSSSNRNVLCNDYTNYTSYSPFVNSDYGISFLYNTTQCYVRDKDISTGRALATKLANNNVYFYYLLATLTNEEITYQPLIDQLNLLEKAMSENEQTNISQINNNLPFIIEASALKKND